MPLANREQQSLYYTWYHMIRRCSDPLDLGFMRYGGRNIIVCMRWRKSFRAFAEDLGERPSPRHSIDRIDNNGNYEPGNVRWATRKEQQRNRRGNHLVTANGITRSVAEWSEALGVNWATVAQRLKLGWSPERAVTQARQRPTGKLTADQVTKAVNLYQAGLPLAPIAGSFGVSRQAMWELLRRRIQLRPQHHCRRASRNLQT